MKIYHFTIPNGGFGQDGIYQCTQFDLMADPSEITRVATNQVSSQTSVSGSTQQTNSQNAVTTFFNSTGDNGNPVVKAFESTKGKGLAGFIKSLKFDWSDARWETGRQNARAPMSVKVAIDFAPIYDINPGLDSDGFMTSPVYNTGETIKVLTEMPDERMQNNTDRSNMNRATTLSYPRSGNGSVNSNGSGAVGGLI
jgi:hypothetical protein